MNTVKTVKFFKGFQKTCFYEQNFKITRRHFSNNVYLNNSPCASLYVNCVRKLNSGNFCKSKNSSQFIKPKMYSTATQENPEATPPLNKENAHALVMRLTGEERTALMTVLQEFESEEMKASYKGEYCWFII